MKRRRGSITVQSVEIVAGTALGLVFFVALLWLLEVSFPDATGLGELVRGGEQSAKGEIEFEMDGRDDEVVAVLSRVRRDVRDRPSASIVWSSAEAGKPLRDRHAVQSLARSGATITFDEHNTLELHEKSVVVVRRPRQVRGSARRQASVLFMEGFLRARLGGEESGDLGVELVTPGGSIRPHQAGGAGAEIALAMDDEMAAVSVHGGAADIVWKDRTTVVPSGHMVTFEPDRPPGEPVPLPRTPELVAPPDGARVSYRAARPRVSFAWRPTDETDRFRLEIALDPEFSEIVYESDLSETKFVHGNLDAGSYHWRVAGLRGEMAGPVSGGSGFVVEPDQSPPELTVEFPSRTVTEPQLVVRGRTEPGCRVFLGDIPVPVDAEGRFAYTTELHQGYNFLVVQSIDTTGNTEFRNHTVVAELNDSE